MSREAAERRPVCELTVEDFEAFSDERKLTLVEFLADEMFSWFGHAQQFPIAAMRASLNWLPEGCADGALCGPHVETRQYMMLLVDLLESTVEKQGDITLLAQIKMDPEQGC